MEIIGKYDSAENQSIEIIIPPEEKPGFNPAALAIILFEIRKAYTIFWLRNQGRVDDAYVYAKCDGITIFDAEAGLRIKNIFGDETLEEQLENSTKIKVIAPPKNNPDILCDFLNALKKSWDSRESE